MNSERHQHAKAIFWAACELPESERNQYTQTACGDDDELLQDVCSLLDEEHRPTDTLLRRADEGSSWRLSGEELVDRRIGRFHIVRLIASGGMGTVYEARQDAPNRAVALKILRTGLTSPSAVRRFEYEAEILGRLRHAGIAQVYEAGTFREAGCDVPYFVMEYIEGALRVTEYAESMQLGLHERLELCIRICGAVHHAHQNGIIHRDLKPGNILIDSLGQPKVIDFGIARIVGGDQQSLTRQKASDEVLGTLPYMSPEQTLMGSGEVDTRSDVYSLGVVLYELLAGRPPFHVPREGPTDFVQLQRAIVEIDPVRPSLCIRSPSLAGGGRESRGTAGSRARGVRANRLRGDLDWIVMKCLDKDPSCRYEGADALAADVRRHLRHEPVVAGPPCTTYRMRKFVRRHWVGVFAASLVVVVMASATVVSSSFALREAEHRRVAEASVLLAEERLERVTVAEREATEQAQVLAAITRFQAEQISNIDTHLMGAQIRRGIYERRQRSLEVAGRSKEEVKEALRRLDAVLAGVSFTSLAVEAIEHNILDGAVATINEKFADDPGLRARLLHKVAVTLRELGRYERAAEYCAESLALQLQIYGDDTEEAYQLFNSMGLILSSLGNDLGAERSHRRALDGWKRLHGDEHRSTLTSMNNLGLVLTNMGNFDEGERHLRHVLETRRRILGNDHHATLTSINNMGHLLVIRGDLEAAEPYREEALERGRRVLGDDDPYTLRQIGQMAYLRYAQGRHSEALEYYREALEGNRRILGDDHPETLTLLHIVGVLTGRLRQFEEAAQHLTEALRGRRRVLGSDHTETLDSLSSLGTVLNQRNRPAEVETFFYEVVEPARRIPGR